MSDPSSPDPFSPSIVRNLQPLQASDKAEVSIKDIVERVEEHQGLAPVVCVLTLPVLLPLPPGFSMVLALPLLVAAPQMMIGRKDLWLPAWLAGRTMKRKTVQGSLRRFLPWLERLEGLVRPRLVFLTGQTGATVVGALCTLMAVVLVLPLPFANLLPSLTVLLLSLGITRRDGLTVLIGIALLAAAVTGVVWGLHGARLGLHRLFHF
jgi:hypothetical protein